MIVSRAKTAEAIEMPFGTWTGWAQGTVYYMGVQIRIREGAIFRAKRDQPRTCPDMSRGRYTLSDSAGGSTGTVRIPTGVSVLDGVTLAQTGVYD